jgi:hypothetical protein
MSSTFVETNSSCGLPSVEACPLLLALVSCLLPNRLPFAIESFELWRNVLVAMHVYELAIEVHTFQFEQVALHEGASVFRQGVDEKLSASADDPLPGQALRAAVHSPADLACHRRGVQEHRNLAIRKYHTAGNAADDGIDPLEERLPIVG